MFNNGFTSRKREVVCVICGKRFFASNPSTKTCSVECSMDNKAAQKKRAVQNSRRYLIRKTRRDLIERGAKLVARK